MSLQRYHQKRDFNQTAEPRGKVTEQSSHLFVVQKHAASHLHYDFRLELNGVLLSWAVPKGPSLVPNVKRLAMHVEDHPVSYGGFEGIIPKGQYGGGTVMLWDRGNWHALDKNPTKAYHDGHLRFELEGQKLHGRWDLFRFKDEKHWFLVKYSDDFAKKKGDITADAPLSVLTNQTIEEIRDHTDQVWTSKKNPRIHLPNPLKTASFPTNISPQLATLVNTAPEGENWLHEIKFDGYRMLTFIKDHAITLRSRNHLDWTQPLGQVKEALKKIADKNLILDGEVVVLDKAGKSDFQLLQNAIKNEAHTPFIYYIFDILYYDKFDLTHLSLIERKKILKQLLPENDPVLRYSDDIVGEGKHVLKQACEYGLEGIVSKRRDGPYETRRSKTWLKAKCINRQEFVIGGYSEPQGGRSHFGSLFLGVYQAGKLTYVGNVGTGFTQSSLQDIYAQLQKQASKKKSV